MIVSPLLYAHVDPGDVSLDYLFQSLETTKEETNHYENIEA